MELQMLFKRFVMRMKGYKPNLVVKFLKVHILLLKGVLGTVDQ